MLARRIKAFVNAATEWASSMATRNTLWQATPSQLSNIGVFVFLCWTIIIPLLAFINTRFTVYELTEDRFFDRSGVLFQRTNQMELIRIRDYEVTRSLIQRLFNKGNLTLITRDPTTPVIVLKWIDGPDEVAEIIRDASEKSKNLRGFREAEVY